jgi:hypothetical protein
MPLADRCDFVRFTTPTIEISSLPSAAEALLQAMARQRPARFPFGATPMGPALAGAIEYAHSFAVEHPGHRVVAILATDGKPTLCDPQDSAGMAAIAADGLDMSPPIQTYTIGVFAPDQTAGPDVVRAIAEAGQGQSFIVDDTQDVAAQFVAALNRIRSRGTSCEFAVYDAPDTDYSKVNVVLTPLEGESVVFDYVRSSENCSPETGGWYYDVQDFDAETPTRILLCPRTCEQQFLDDVVGVNIAIGCKTVVK